jgi:FAD/FMN-containing dehydrogenase
MRRRDFCRSALAAGVTAAIPGGYTFADALQARALPAITSQGAETSIEAAAVSELAGSLRGPLLMNGDAAYDHARAVWNGMIDRKPALIARCEGPSDVSNAIRFAEERDLLVAVRGGGHSISGKAVPEGGLMIDLSNMNSVRVDRANRIARADGGCLTGAGGLTLGGGFGRLCRKFGMACDNLIGADIVSVDGEVHHVDDERNPDLMWALRGGGSNFGIATSLVFALHEQDPMVVAGDIDFAWKDARDVLMYFAEHGSNMPDELNLNVMLMTDPDAGQMVSVEAVWSGDPSRADTTLAPLRAIAEPIADTVALVPYAKFQTRSDNSNRHGVRMYMKSSFVTEITAELVDELLDIHRPSPIYAIYFMQSGGAVNRRTPSDTAFPHRSAHSNMMVWNQWFDMESIQEREDRIREVREDWARLAKYTHGYYVNLNDEDAARTHTNYGDNYARLVEVKSRYDPRNLMRLNANIEPTA